MDAGGEAACCYHRPNKTLHLAPGAIWFDPSARNCWCFIGSFRLSAAPARAAADRLRCGAERGRPIKREVAGAVKRRAA